MSRSGKKEHRVQRAAYPNQQCGLAAPLIAGGLIHTDRNALRLTNQADNRLATATIGFVAHLFLFTS